jgi:hypothetical protein
VSLMLSTIQFDLKEAPAGRSSTSSLWLTSCITSTVIDMAVNAPLASFLQTYLLCFYSRYVLQKEMEESTDQVSAC